MNSRRAPGSVLEVIHPSATLGLSDCIFDVTGIRLLTTHDAGQSDQWRCGFHESMTPRFGIAISASSRQVSSKRPSTIMRAVARRTLTLMLGGPSAEELVVSAFEGQRCVARGFPRGREGSRQHFSYVVKVHGHLANCPSMYRIIKSAQYSLSSSSR